MIRTGLLQYFPRSPCYILLQQALAFKINVPLFYTDLIRTSEQGQKHLTKQCSVVYREGLDRKLRSYCSNKC